MSKQLTVLFGIVFIVVGILGFMPAVSPLHSDGMRYLLGFFMVDGIHNLIHLLSGVGALAGGLTSERYARLYFKIFGVVYVLVTIVGFIQKTTLLSIFHVNTADNFLHLGLAIVILGIGFLLKPRETVATGKRDSFSIQLRIYSRFYNRRGYFFLFRYLVKDNTLNYRPCRHQ